MIGNVPKEAIRTLEVVQAQFIDAFMHEKRTINGAFADGDMGRVR